MKNSFCFKIWNCKSLKNLVITSGNAKVSWKCQFTRKNQIKNGATKSVYFYNDDKLIILVQPIKHSIYTSKPWQAEEFLIWWINIGFIYSFLGMSLHSTLHLFWDSVQMLACCCFAKLEGVPPQQCKYWERKQSGETCVLPVMGRYKDNHRASLRSCQMQNSIYCLGRKEKN